MTAGTKIFLAFVALFVAVLVVYYAFLMDDDAPPLVMDDTTPSAEVREEPESRERTAPEPRVEEREERPRILGTPRAQPEPEPERELVEAAEVPDEREEPDREQHENDAQLEDHSPVIVREQPSDEGGKDAPEVEAASDEAEAEDDAEGGAEREREREQQRAARERERQRELERQRQQRQVPQPRQYTEYTVRTGDTMTLIAADWFGDAGKWDLIAQANPYVDPNRMTVGQVLRLPPKDAQRGPIEGRAGERETVYVVRSGDNLTKIARAYYNDAGLWRLIYDANRQTIGNDPGRLRVGMRLTIPPAPRPARSDETDDA